jgi:hypothetical protein
VSKCLVLLTLVLASYFSSYSQTTWEGGISIGPSGFLGDLGGNVGKGTSFLKDYNTPTTKLMLGANITAYPAPWLGFRFAMHYGHIEGNDALIKPKGGDEDSRKDRNLDFRSPILEGFAGMEIYPTVFLEDDPTDVKGRLRPYGMIGIGVFHFNPQGTYIDNGGNVNWVDLRPLRTEGEGLIPGKPMYSLTQINIPIAVGLKYYFSENLNISFEILYRKSFTDYLDDVSTTFVDPSIYATAVANGTMTAQQAAIANQMSNKSPLRTVGPSSYGPGAKRGDPTQPDAYFSAEFKIGFRLFDPNETRWKSSTHCPLLRF